MDNKKIINVNIGRRIKKYREAAGYIQDDFSELIQMGSKNLSAVERGTVGISLSMIRTICKTLSISSDMLIMDEIEDVDFDRLDFLMERMKQLSPEQFEIAYAVMNKLFEAFALEYKERK